MKKNIFIIIIALLGLTSCYEDYVENYANPAVGFANNVDVRSIVVGEGMTFSTGVALAGVIDNTEDRTVSYQVQDTLASSAKLAAMTTSAQSYIVSYAKGIKSLKLLPSSEYSLVNEGGKSGETIIRKGSHVGKITVQIDSAAYFSGSASLTPDYVIPLEITDGNGIDIMSGYSYTVIGVRYENMLFGNWWHGGKAVLDDGSKTQTYYTTIPQSTDKVWTLTTVSPHSLTANAVAGVMKGNDAQMKLTLGENGSVTIEPVDGATYQVEPDGESRYNRAGLLQDRKIFLNYKFTDKDGNLWHATDTLTFRNRVRDGVNEWQDENQENYQ